MGVVAGILVLGLFMTSMFGSGPTGGGLSFGTSTTRTGGSSTSAPTRTLLSTLGSSTAASTETSALTTTSSSTATTSGLSGGGATLGCFLNVNETSGSSFSVNGISGYRTQFLNPAGTVVVVYGFSQLQSVVLPGGSTGYSLSFAPNSTFTGVYISGYLSGNYTVLGFAGISGSKYYTQYPSGTSQTITMKYLVPQASSFPYVIGATNSYGAPQTVTVSGAFLATCGDSWIAQASALQ